MFGRDYVRVGGQWWHNLERIQNFPIFHVKAFLNAIKTMSLSKWHHCQRSQSHFWENLFCFPRVARFCFSIHLRSRLEMCFYFLSPPHTLPRHYDSSVSITETSEMNESKQKSWRKIIIHPYQSPAWTRNFYIHLFLKRFILFSEF